jgi:hypothetical protein
MKEITYGDINFKYDQSLSTEYINLEYDEKLCCKMKLMKKYTSLERSEILQRSWSFSRKHVIYADFECTTDGEYHKPYLISFQSAKAKHTMNCYGQDCVTEFLNYLPTGSLVYFHNLTYDISFIRNKLNFILDNPIIKNSRTYQLDGKYKNKIFRFKDTYAIIPTALKTFSEMFKLPIEKEVFPYDYYTENIVFNDNIFGNLKDVSQMSSDPDQFIENCKKLKLLDQSNQQFNIKEYAKYYCMKDVEVLKIGFEQFRENLLKRFNIDVYDSVSISSIVDKYFNETVYSLNGNIYELANKPREFISQCVYGG